MGENTFIPKAIEIVKEAIEKDNAQEYSEALTLYGRALEYFMTGLKYERNETSRATIMKRVDGYLKRAEQLKEILDGGGQAVAPSRGGGGGGGVAAAKRGEEKKENADEAEQRRLRGALSDAIVTTKPNVRWEDVAGLDQAKDSLKEAVILPVRFPQLFAGKIEPWKGILLYGPPGTGKSYLAKAVATEADATFFAVSSADLVSKWQGESQKLVRNLFELAREAGNAIIFIDEVDSLCSSRSEGENESARQIKTEFLVQMDGVQASAAREGAGPGRVLVLGATNVPWELDAAIRRRFEKRVYIPLPEGPARARMFQIHIGDTPNTLTEEDFERLGEMSEGYSGSDISVLIREALYEPVRKCQQAKQWLLTPEGLYTPCEEYPSCDQCPPKLSSDPPGTQYPPCHNCSAVRMNLYDIASDKLKVPILGFGDFQKALEKARPSVAQEELGEFVEWTEEFGQEG
ncbi:unnamed protein product [Heterosigma akashiwo]|uniref:vesicle-fusing ATPase n=1 Tax=Heterosigma akashiwo TaxID=2829 RepID=A0A6V1TB96_HETAK|mmetsp:Transcript_7130/g.11753  ORF Transcript_7130/g.11753 Transcript_7130/m.11753 type:complete len:461 (+) Transcript_7130:104-1486(+)